MRISLKALISISGSKQAPTAPPNRLESNVPSSHRTTSQSKKHRSDGPMESDQSLKHRRSSGSSGVVPSNQIYTDTPAQGHSDKRPEQIGYYIGDARRILEKAKLSIRVHLATDDLNPSVPDIKDIIAITFEDGCSSVLGRRIHRTSAV